MPGPLVVHWLGCELPEVRAGAAAEGIVEVENAGSAAWRPDVNLSYHWLDQLGNPIVWDGVRTPLAHLVEPGQRLRAALRLRGPIPPGRYRLAIDLVDEGLLWFADAGNRALEVEQDVAPRIDRALGAPRRPRSPCHSPGPLRDSRPAMVLERSIDLDVIAQPV